MNKMVIRFEPSRGLFIFFEGSGDPRDRHHIIGVKYELPEEGIHVSIGKTAHFDKEDKGWNYVYV